MKTENEKTMEAIYLLVCRYFDPAQRRTLIAFLAARDFFQRQPGNFYDHEEAHK